MSLVGCAAVIPPTAAASTPVTVFVPPPAAAAAVESDDASSRGVLDLLESKFEGGAKIDFSVSGEVVGIYGVKVEECQLARLIEKQGVAAGWVARARGLFLTVSPPFIERTG